MDKKLLNTKKYDFLIVGSGIVGLTVAKELSERHPQASIAILEKEKHIGMHASGRNSGVLHSGIYYPQDSIKSKICADGATRMMAFAKEHHIPCHKTGKVIIATCEAEVPTIDHLLKNAANNNIRAERLDEKQVQELEPYAKPHRFGIHTPDTACINSMMVLEKMLEIVQSRGVELHLNQKVIAADNKTRTVTTGSDKFQYGFLINCAGAGADKIAKMLDLAKEYTFLPFKGIYYKLGKDKADLVRGNIYPVPDLNLPFLGVHVTRNMSGDVYVGPTAIPAFGRENYGILQGVSAEAFRIARDIMLMYISNQQHFRALMHSEIKKYSKKYFVQSARKLVTSIDESDLHASNKVGIRPQLINLSKRKIEMDYIVEQNESSLHVLNAISPAFTGSLSFATLLVNKI